MLNLKQYSCVNPKCSHFGLRNQGNIVKYGTYGKYKRQVLKCKICNKRFSETRNTALFGTKYSPEKVQAIVRCVAEGNGVRSTARILHLSKDSVNQIILKVGEHCHKVLSELLETLHLEQCQLDELFAFVQKKELFPRPTGRADADKSGSG